VGRKVFMHVQVRIPGASKPIGLEYDTHRFDCTEAKEKREKREERREKREERREKREERREKREETKIHKPIHR
jgi:hypothetical protein